MLQYLSAWVFTSHERVGGRLVLCLPACPVAIIIVSSIGWTWSTNVV